MWNINICTSSFDKNLIQFKNKKFEFKLNPYFRKMSEKELLNFVDEKTIGIISGTERITKKF